MISFEQRGIEMRELPAGYFIIDAEVEPHDGDEDDGRYGLYCGDVNDPEEAEFLGNLDDREEVVRLAHEHQAQV
jgi:hypothetical protein